MVVAAFVAPPLRERLVAHWRVDDALDPRRLACAVRGVSEQLGRVERLVGALEQLRPFRVASSRDDVCLWRLSKPKMRHQRASSRPALKPPPERLRTCGRWNVTVITGAVDVYPPLIPL